MRPVGRREPFGNGSHVVADRAFTDAEQLAHLSVRSTAGDVPKDLQVTIRQREMSRWVSVGRRRCAFIGLAGAVGPVGAAAGHEKLASGSE